MMFTGTSQQQDTRFSDKEKKLMKQLRFGNCLNQRVDMSKVKLDCIRPWISKKITDLLHMEDDVVVEFVYNQLEEEKFPCPKKMQINMTGFLNGKNARQFMDELWALLLSAQESSTGIPKEFIDQKKEEILKREQEEKEKEDRHRNDDSLASAMSREEAVMRQIEKIKESARIKDDLLLKTNSIVLAKADEISEKLRRQMAATAGTADPKEEAAALGAAEVPLEKKPDESAEKDQETNSNNNTHKRSKSPESRIKSRNYRGRSRNRSPQEKSNHRAPRNRSRSRGRTSPSKEVRSRSRDRRIGSPRARGRQDQSGSRSRRGRSRSYSPARNRNREKTNQRRRPNRSPERDRRPRDKDRERKYSRSVSPAVDKHKKKNRSATPEKKPRRMERLDSSPAPAKASRGDGRRDRQAERSNRKSLSPRPMRDVSRDRRDVSRDRRDDDNSRKRVDNAKEQDSPKEKLLGQANGGGRKRQPKLSVDESDEEDRKLQRGREAVRKQAPITFVHDSSISRTPSPFLTADERVPELMVGTLVEKLALKRKQQVKLPENGNSSSDSEPAKRSKTQEQPEELSRKEAKKLKKAKKSKKSKKSKKRSADPESKESRDELEKQLRERALKSMRKHKLSSSAE